jgi:hypothetical protein
MWRSWSIWGITAVDVVIITAMISAKEGPRDLGSGEEPRATGETNTPRRPGGRERLFNPVEPPQTYRRAAPARRLHVHYIHGGRYPPVLAGLDLLSAGHGGPGASKLHVVHV